MQMYKQTCTGYRGVSTCFHGLDSVRAGKEGKTIGEPNQANDGEESQGYGPARTTPGPPMTVDISE